MIYIPPGEPWRNGRLERFHWTMETEYWRDERPSGIKEALDGLAEWLNYYNMERPHSSIGRKPPASRGTYQPVDAAMLQELPQRLPRQAGTVEAIRLVMPEGRSELWNGGEFRVSPYLTGAYVRVQLTVPGPAHGRVLYSPKRGVYVPVAIFSHLMDADPAPGPHTPLVSEVEHVDFEAPPTNAGVDIERAANQRSRITKRESPLDKELREAAHGTD